MASEGYRVAVVGATGQVGTLMLQLLRERRFRASEIVPFASKRSAGRELGEGLVVRALSDDAVEGFDLAIFSAEDVLRYLRGERPNHLINPGART